MMNPKIILTFSIVASIVILFHACKDDDKLEPNNPLNGKTKAVFNPNVSYGTMSDIDGNVYKTVTIGTQEWMAENLRTTTYNDGTSISNVTDFLEWSSLNTGAYCNYNHTLDEDTIATFGRMYNWHAVNTGKLAPKGWHVPTDAEWATLCNYLGGETVAGGKLREAGTLHWQTPNTGATNESGFTALPAGNRYYLDVFDGIGFMGAWWSASEDIVDFALIRYIFSDNTLLIREIERKASGKSVRCVKD